MPPSLVDYVRQGSTRKGGSSPSSAPRSPIDEDRSYNGSDWGNENGCHGSDPRDSYIGQELSWLPGCQRMGASSPRTSSSRQEVDDTEVDAALTALDMESNSMFAPTGSTAAKTKLRRRASLGTSLKKAQRDQENVQEELPMDTETFVKDIKERAKKENQAVESELAYALSHLNGTLIFSPHHWARQLWDWLVVLSVFMTIMLVPVALGFADRIDSITTLATLAGLDGIWWVDIIVSLRTAITHEGDFGRESLITRPGDIAWAYFRTHFALDLLAALPYFAMHISAERGLDFNHLATNASSGTLLILTIASVVPIPMALLRLQRIVRVKHVKDRLLPNTGSAQLTRIGVGIVYLLHVLGCIYWFVSVVELKRALRAEGSVTVWDGKFSPPLLYASYLPEGQQALLAINATDQLATGLTTPVTHGVGSSYLCAFVWATLGLTALEVERPSNTQQNALIILVACCSFLINAVLIGSVSAVLATKNHARSMEVAQRKAIEAYLKHEGIPRELRKRIDEFYDFRGGVSQARGEHDILPSLPAGLRSQLDIFKKREIFTSLPLFQECSYEQVIDLVKGVERIFTIPGRILIQEGILADGLYMIVSGSVSILSKSGTILATRVVGEVLGENSLLETTPARATCITTAFWCAAHVQPWHDPCRVSMAGAAAIIAHGSVPELLISLNALRTVPLTEIFMLPRAEFAKLVARHPDLLERIKLFSKNKDSAIHQAACTRQLKLTESRKTECISRNTNVCRDCRAINEDSEERGSRVVGGIWGGIVGARNSYCGDGVAPGRHKNSVLRARFAPGTRSSVDIPRGNTDGSVRGWRLIRKQMRSDGGDTDPDGSVRAWRKRIAASSGAGSGVGVGIATGKPEPCSV